MIDSMRFDDYRPEPDIRRAATLPARWYVEPEFLEAERARVFGATWQPVAHADDVREPGAWVATEIAGDQVLVARGVDGKLRAFSNVCRHRAAQVATGRGVSASLRCPYHGWTYGMDGKLMDASEMEGAKGFEPRSVCLPEFRVAEWGPYVFVNQDTGAAEFEAAPGPMEPLPLAGRRDYALECNWKVYVERALAGARDWQFPNLMLWALEAGLRADIILPLGPGRTLVIVEWFSAGGGEVPADVIQSSDQAQQEAAAICQAVQKGLESRSYSAGRLSPQREGEVHRFHLLLQEHLTRVSG